MLFTKVSTTTKSAEQFCFDKRTEKTCCSVPVDFLLASCGVPNTVRWHRRQLWRWLPHSCLLFLPFRDLLSGWQRTLICSACVHVLVSLACLYQLSLSSGPGGWRTEVHCMLLMFVSNIIMANELAALGTCASMSLTAPSSAYLHIWHTFSYLFDPS